MGGRVKDHISGSTSIGATSQVAPIALARDAFERGDFRRGLVILDTCEDNPEKTVLMARFLLRLARPLDALELFRTRSSDLTWTQNDATTARMLVAVAQSRCEDLQLGLTALLDLYVTLEPGISRAVTADIEYEIALAFWTLRKYDDASIWAVASQNRDVGVASVRAFALRGWILQAQERFEEAVLVFREALDAYDRCIERDQHTRATIVHAIAALDANLLSQSRQGTEIQRNERLARLATQDPTSTPVPRLKTAIEDAWAFAIEGDDENATRAACLADELAPTPTWRVWTIAVRAAIAGALNESSSALGFAERAVALAQQIDWEGTSDEERVGLLSAAEQIRHFDPVAAQLLLTRFLAISTPIESRIAIDARHDGYLKFVIGAVSASNFQYDIARDQLLGAFESLRRIGYMWRAVLALLELDTLEIKLAEADARHMIHSGYLETATKLVVEHFPNSFLRRRLSWFDNDELAAALTGAQRKVLRYFLLGHAPAEIASLTRCKIKTVRNHLEAVRKKFNADSTNELFANCIDRGYRAETLRSKTA